jgi:sortase A
VSTETLTAGDARAVNRTRRRMIRRLIRDVSSVLIISGLLLVIDAGVTIVWQEPITAVIAMIKQASVNKTYLSFKTAPLSRLDAHALGGLETMNQKIAFLARREAHEVATGDAIGKISIPKIGVSYDLIQGTDTDSLEKGPGHYPGTAFPGLGQTVGIAGHRTTYLAPFRHIDALRPGNKIVLNMPYAKLTYVVQYTKIVLPTALWVTDNVGYERLILSACNPLYSAAQRIIVFARLSEVTPEGATTKSSV